MPRVVVVTGATGNLGQAVIKKFLKEGDKVIGTVIPDDPAKSELNNPNFETAIVNLLDEENTREFIDSVIQKYERIDVAVLTVGGFAMGSVLETCTNDILKQYRLNFETTYNCARPVFQQMMKQDKGRIFLVGSRPGMDAKFGKGMIAYGLSKSLIFRLAELMNDEAKGKNVVTSVIVPSTIDTPQNRKAMPDTDPSKWVKAEVIANTIYFYCSEEASALREPLIKVYNNS